MTISPTIMRQSETVKVYFFLNEQKRGKKKTVRHIYSNRGRHNENSSLFKEHIYTYDNPSVKSLRARKTAGKV